MTTTDKPRLSSKSSSDAARLLTEVRHELDFSKEKAKAAGKDPS